MKNLTPFQEKFKKLCISLGNNNKALYGALTIALSKGILRPTFTMMDKKQEKNSRKYTAFREGLTGAVAFIAYLATESFVDKMAGYIAKKTNHLDELPKMKTTLSLVSVSLTALFIIPGICNLITKPLLDKITKRDNAKLPKTNTYNQVKGISAPNFGSYQSMYHMRNFYNSGMKIGGL